MTDPTDEPSENQPADEDAERAVGAMDESEAIDALEGLGLSNYEAKVFAALQRLGTATARDVHSVTDVPRSQVYGAAESLQKRGLVEVQQSKPKQYRPVSLEAARAHLRGEFERTQQQAFDYLEAAREQRGDADEQREDIWTVHGRASIDSRVEQLLAEAEERVLFGVGQDATGLSGDLAERLVDRAEAGVEVVVVADQAVADAFEDTPVEVRQLPTDHLKGEDPIARVLVVDGETVLLSVRDRRDAPELDDETAIWSSRTAIAAVLIQLIDGGLGDAVSV